MPGGAGREQQRGGCAAHAHSSVQGTRGGRVARPAGRDRRVVPHARCDAAVARRHDVLLIDDLGSGASEPVADEPTVAESLRLSDVVTFSGDKLLGGPQAGVILARSARGAEAVRKLSRHPLARAVRIDKLTLAALEATLRLRLAGRLEDIPV